MPSTEQATEPEADVVDDRGPWVNLRVTVEEWNLSHELEDKVCVGCLTVIHFDACPNVANDLATPLCIDCCGEGH